MNDRYAFISRLKILKNSKTCQNFLKILLGKFDFISNFNILNNDYVRNLLCSR